MAKFKFYGTWHYFAPINDINTQCRAVVMARTKKNAAAALGMSLYEFNNYACETGNAKEVLSAKNAGENEVVVIRGS